MIRQKLADAVRGELPTLTRREVRLPAVPNNVQPHAMNRLAQVAVCASCHGR